MVYSIIFSEFGNAKIDMLKVIVYGSSILVLVCQ